PAFRGHRALGGRRGRTERGHRRFRQRPGVFLPADGTAGEDRPRTRPARGYRATSQPADRLRCRAHGAGKHRGTRTIARARHLARRHHRRGAGIARAERLRGRVRRRRARRLRTLRRAVARDRGARLMNGNFSGALIFLVNTLLGLYAMTILLRFLLQLVRADFYNPLSQFVVKVTNPLLRPLRRIIPGAMGLDLAALLLFYLVALITVALLALIAGATLPAAYLLWFALLKCIVIAIQLFFFTILIQVILSWVAQGWHPVAGALHAVNEPLLRPFRRLLPPLGGFDLSPLFAIILLQFLSFLIPLPPLFR